MSNAADEIAVPSQALWGDGGQGALPGLVAVLG